MGLIKLWFKMVWKMRSIYASFAVHIFDVLTDILVILEWWNLENNGNDIKNVDARVMSICGILIMFFHRFITTFVFWVKERNLFRCLLQFVDLLILQEIYIGHRMIVSQFRNQSESYKSTKNTINTSTSFKTIRSLEAVFESLPQSVLQLVFITRTSELNYYTSTTLLIISILSIVQSVISMANSILNSDNMYMNATKYKKHLQRLPPTIPFLKHALCRISEVVYRIGLLSLLWVVCGGTVFGIVAGFELLLILILAIGPAKVNKPPKKVTAAALFKFVPYIIVTPSDKLGSANLSRHIKHIFAGENHFLVAMMLCTLCCCLPCCTVSGLIASCCGLRKRSVGGPVVYRIGISLMEWVLLILWPFIDETRWKYLFSDEHGLYLFIISFVCFLIFTQYLSLIPSFSLPINIDATKRFGQAFNGELEELKNIKPKIPSIIRQYRIITWINKETKRKNHYWLYQDFDINDE
eukprot:56047_1